MPAGVYHLYGSKKRERMNNNRKAFLDMIARAEGTPLVGDQDGYNVMVGNELFHDYSDHPRKVVWIPRLKISSTAAGRYQLLSRYWDHYKKNLSLPDFGPASQDAVALQQIRECRALDDVDAGRFAAAVRKVNRIWASLPGSPYGQAKLDLPTVLKYYIDAGGKLVTKKYDLT